MTRKNPKDFTTIEVRKKDYKKLCESKIHQNQPAWEVIKNLLKKEED